MMNMNCFKGMAAALLACCILAGCSGHSSNVGLVKVPEETDAKLPDFGLPDKTDKDIPEVLKLNKDLFDGSDMKIWSGKDETLIVLKEDTLYLYDVVKAQILAEGKTQQWFLPQVHLCDDGFCIIGSIREDVSDDNMGEDTPFLGKIVEDSTCEAVFYNDSLQETDRIILNDIVEYPDATMWTASPDGSMLGYFNIWNGLCIYDCGSGTVKQLLNVSGPLDKISNLLGPDAIFFDMENERLVFTGQTSKNNITFESWGYIGLDGTGYENHIFEKNPGAAVGYKNGKLLLGEDSLMFEGRMGYVDVDLKKEEYGNNVEGGYTIGGPVFSDSGNTFATTDIAEDKVVLKIYNTADFSEICQEVFEDENKELFYSQPKVFLFDRLRTCLVYMGGYKEIPMKAYFVKY